MFTEVLRNVKRFSSFDPGLTKKKKTDVSDAVKLVCLLLLPTYAFLQYEVEYHATVAPKCSTGPSPVDAGAARAALEVEQLINPMMADVGMEGATVKVCMRCFSNRC